ncbi:MAG: acetylxylan esterase [Candidatus Brockarchaeota archaeon]|nr:acetylxylan esterase [Candidatus Brockarchaeota archaeon]
MNPDIGIYYGLAHDIASSMEPSLSYLSRDWPEVEAWRSLARGKVLELLDFTPPSAPLNPSVDSTASHDGVVIESVSYDMPYGPRTRGFFMYPEDRQGMLPAVVALHDHGGMKYYGKEKICWIPDEPEVLKKFKQEYYGGRSWATELAKRGFAVLSADAFLFGSRKIPIASLSDEFQRKFDNLEEGAEEYVLQYNAFAGEHEHLVAKTLFMAGTTWPGVFAYEDRRSVDYILTRKEVDPERIGCGGLSGGGLRTIFLAGLDPRIKCAVCVGFMSTFKGLLRNNIKCHTWMLYLPHLPRFLDMPDLLALMAPNPLMVQYDLEDDLYTLEGQRGADRKISMIYGKMGKSAHYSGKFYPGPHKFDAEMQEDAFDWFKRWLGKP